MRSADNSVWISLPRGGHCAVVTLVSFAISGGFALAAAVEVTAELPLAAGGQFGVPE